MSQSNSLAPTPAVLPPGQGMHVWVVDQRAIQDPNLWREYRDLLDAPELERYERLRREDLKRQHLLARAAQRYVLSKYAAHVAPAAWRFISGQRGKPSIDPRHGVTLHFNVAHSRGIVVLAVCEACCVGIDVESWADRAAPLKIAQHYFTPREAMQLRELPGGDQPSRFFALWTLKEAYSKTVGTGVYSALDTVEFDFTHRTACLARGAALSPPEAWRFWALQLRAQCMIALAAYGCDQMADPVIHELVPLRSERIVQVQKCFDVEVRAARD